MSEPLRAMPPVPWRLRPYQVEALRGVSTAWIAGHRRALLVLATGLGKTTVFVEVVRRRAQRGAKPALILAHRIELVTQAAARLRAGGLTVAIESGDAYAHPYELSRHDAVVATVQTLRGKRLTRWPETYFGTVICDEAHHAAAASYRAILDHFAGANHLGVTATPDRGDDVAIGHVYPHLAYSYGIREGIEAGYLAPIRSLLIDTPSIDLASVRVTKQAHGRDLNTDDLAAAMRGDAALHEIAGPIAKEARDRQTLVFTPDVATAHALAEVLSAYLGASAVASLDGTSDEATRGRTLAAYQRGDVKALVNCALFTEGFDAPATGCVAIARPTKSRALYTQMVGRGTRTTTGTIDGVDAVEDRLAAIAASVKPDCLVLNFQPTNCAHSLISPVDLFAGDDLPDDVRAAAKKAEAEGGDPLKAMAEAEARAAEEESRRRSARARSRIVADVRYRAIHVDPFVDLGLAEPTMHQTKGPRASKAMADALERAGIKGADALSMAEGKALLEELTNRRRKGLCTLKQSRALGRAGLRGDLPFAEARGALDALAANGWRMTAAMAERWGAE